MKKTKIMDTFKLRIQTRQTIPKNKRELQFPQNDWTCTFENRTGHHQRAIFCNSFPKNYLEKQLYIYVLHVCWPMPYLLQSERKKGENKTTTTKTKNKKTKKPKKTKNKKQKNKTTKKQKTRLMKVTKGWVPWGQFFLVSWFLFFVFFGFLVFWFVVGKTTQK